MRYSRIARLVLTGMAAIAAGCVSDQPAPNTVRTAAATAPADLQITCASVAAQQLGVDAGRVLPVSSAQLDAQRYRVDLDAGGSRATCVVDANGNVLSVSRA